MPITVATVTIPAGQSLSDAADISSGTLLRFRMPADWTPANVSFQLAPSDTPAEFRDIWTVAGELLVPMYPDRVVLVDGSGASLREGFLKIRSGAADYPINQAADRAFQLVIFR